MDALKGALLLKSTPGTLSGGGHYTVRPMALPLDWLQMRYSIGRDPRSRPWGNADIIPLRDRFALERQSAGTRAFARHDLLRHAGTGRIVAEVWSCPRNETALRANEVMVKSSNESLYDFTWYPTLCELMDGLGWDYRATTKLDVAADGYGFLEPWAAAMRGDIVHGGRSPWKVGNYPGVQGVRNIEVAERNANKFARIYKKEEEILKSGKTYIHNYWAKCGLAPEGVQRCELSVKGRELRRYFDDRSRDFLEALTDPLSRAEVFRSIAATFIRFHTGEARSRDRSDVLFWDWSHIANGEEVPVAKRAPRVLDIGTNFVKGHIKLSFMLHVATGSARYLSTAQEVAAASNLGAWLAGHMELFRRDAEKLNATGLRASGLFDMMQGVDEANDAALRAQPRAKLDRLNELEAAANASRVAGVDTDRPTPVGIAKRYERARRKRS